MKIRNTILFLLAMLPGLLPLALTSTLAQSQSSAYAGAAPRIDGFDVEQAPRLTAGNDLTFTLYGSIGGTATVRINGVVDRFTLEEMEPGVYEGTYTIKARDRINADTLVTANLRVGNRIATEVLDESLQTGVASRAEAKRVADVAAVAAIPLISRFEVDPPARLDSGTALFFTMAGSPGGTAGVRINGVKGKVSLPEVTAGVYEGAYTIKDRDRISATSGATATLRLGDRETSAVLGQSMVAAPGRAPSARRAALNCPNCGVVESINVVEVNGNGSYLGKIAGGVVGAVLGSQVGSGRGTTAAEIAGAVGGAVVGNEIEKRVKKSKHYDVTARLRSGGTQVISFANEPALRVGDKVRVENGTLVPDS